MTTSDKVKLLVFMLLGMGGWMQTLARWQDATTPGAISGLFIIIGSGLGLAFGVNTNGAVAGLVRRLTGGGDTPTPKE